MCTEDSLSAQVLYLFPKPRNPGYVFSTLTVGEKGVAAYSLLDVTSQNVEGQEPKLRMPTDRPITDAPHDVKVKQAS